MTKAIGTAHVPGTITLERESTHRIIPIPGLPACPAWCVGDCVGGDVEQFSDGLLTTTDRLHELNLTAMIVADGDRTDDREDVRLFIERLDSVEPDAPAPMVTRVLFEMDRHGAPRIIGEIDVADVTRAWSDWHCRVLAAQVLTGATGPRRLALTSAELRQLGRAALEAADLLDAADAAEGR
jgi:hypothetical protein